MVPVSWGEGQDCSTRLAGPGRGCTHVRVVFRPRFLLRTSLVASSLFSALLLRAGPQPPRLAPQSRRCLWGCLPGFQVGRARLGGFSAQVAQLTGGRAGTWPILHQSPEPSWRVRNPTARSAGKTWDPPVLPLQGLCGRRSSVQGPHESRHSRPEGPRHPCLVATSACQAP